MTIFWKGLLHTRKDFQDMYFIWCVHCMQQGSKFSDFFSTPRTILEISVNLMRKCFWRGRGGGIGVKWPRTAQAYTICDPWSQKIFWRKTPRPRYNSMYCIGFIYNKLAFPCARSMLHVFQTFWMKPILIPGWGKNLIGGSHISENYKTMYSCHCFNVAFKLLDKKTIP